MNQPPERGGASASRPVVVDVMTGVQLSPDTLEYLRPEHRYGLTQERLEAVLNGAKSAVLEVEG